MARKVSLAPFKNITNRANSKKDTYLSSEEQQVLIKHKENDQRAPCSVSKYSSAIFEHYTNLDKIFEFREVDVTWEMRSLLIDWLISCHEKLKLSDDSLHMCIFLIDRFLSARNLSPSKLQMVGITALVIAAKYEEVMCPDLNSFLSLSDGSFGTDDLKKAEKYMLFSIDYNLEYVNPLVFLRRAAKANNYESKSRKMGKYFLELMLLHKQFAKYTKNLLCATAMYLSRKICKTDFNKNLFYYYSKIERGEIRECFDELVRLIFLDPLYENIETKYSRPSQMEVSVVARQYAREHFE
ncbi:G2/mitotic-specific cyclin 2 [Enteropsectra breve]|nr:G2/mitotic-specific cyclin 2 [Enteropsectra breve]